MVRSGRAFKPVPVNTSRRICFLPGATQSPPDLGMPLLLSPLSIFLSNYKNILNLNFVCKYFFSFFFFFLYNFWILFNSSNFQGFFLNLGSWFILFTSPPCRKWFSSCLLKGNYLISVSARWYAKQSKTPGPKLATHLLRHGQGPVSVPKNPQIQGFLQYITLVSNK